MKAALVVSLFLLAAVVVAQEPAAINVAEAMAGSPQGVDAGQGATLAPTELTPGTVIPGPQGPAGQPGASGRDGRNGRSGRDGRPGKDAQLPRDWSRQAPRAWSGDSTKALTGDGTGLHAGRPLTREEGAALTQREDAKVETAANRHTNKKVGEERNERSVGDNDLKTWIYLIVLVLGVAVVGGLAVVAYRARH